MNQQAEQPQIPVPPITDPCDHIDQIGPVTPHDTGCQECLRTGSRWVNLRICMVCGHVGCCDHSVGKHATKHYHATGHPIIKSFKPDEEWMWCYVDEKLIAR
jgi:uncharacterized UBP type Zn finger protein